MEINCPFKNHKNLLGKPGKGIHSYRFLNIAIMDYIQTIGVSMLTTYLTKIPLMFYNTEKLRSARTCMSKLMKQK